MPNQDTEPSSKAKQLESANEKELREKVVRLVESKFNSDWRRAFDHYAKTGEAVDRDELCTLFEDAGIGNPITRGAWADGVLAKLDINLNKAITWDEFEPLLGHPATNWPK